MTADSCYYCGLPATDTEHVIQRTALRSLQSVGIDVLQEVTGQRKLLVRACRECNALLIGTFQFSLAERKTFVKMRLRQRYAKLLAMPSWSEEELDSIEKHLRSHIVNALREKKIVQERISW